MELVRAAQDSAGFVRYLELLEAHHQAARREVFLVLDNGSAHTSQVSLQALAARRDWLHVIWLAKYAPQLNPKEREWRYLKRDRARIWRRACVTLSMASCAEYASCRAPSRPSLTRCPSGSSMATANRRPVAHPVEPLAPRIPTSERPITETELPPAPT